MMQKIKDSTIGSNFVLNFQAQHRPSNENSANTTPVGDQDMREDNQAQVISTDAARLQQLQTNSPGYQMVAPVNLTFEPSGAAGQGQQQPAYKDHTMYHNLGGMLNLSHLPNTLSFLMASGGVILDRRAIKIDAQGYVNTQTGERYQRIIAADIQYGEVLGQGNGGKVLAGLHVASGIPVAIKVINLYDKDKRHQFYNEFEMLNETLPQFVQYHGIFYNEGMINLVMEFMDCGSIQTIIAVEKAFKTQEQLQSGPLIPEVIISKFVSHVLMGLVYLHEEKRQIHRDLKSDNILVESKFGMAKLTDFGISKRLSEAEGMGGQSTRTYTGTLCYMSPERLANLDYSYPSDIWSLGIVVYEMATGEHPYSLSAQPIEIENLINNHPAPSLHGSPQVSPQLANFVSRCLQKEPNQRAHARDLASDPFVQMIFTFSDEEHVAWLGHYRQRQERLKQINMSTQIQMADIC